MTRTFLIELIVLNVPLLICIGLWAFLRIYSRLRIAVVGATVWQFAVLPWLNLWAQHCGFWSFESSGAQILGMPLAFYLGWVIWWGVAAPILMGKLPVKRALLWVAVAFLVVDLIAMPALRPVLLLGEHWMLGELAVIAVGLCPALWLSHATLLDRTVGRRAAMLTLGFVVFLLGVLPLAGGRDVASVAEVLQNRSVIGNVALVGFAFLLGSLGLAGVVEFVRAGRGTPIPLDPPRKLVTSGPYAYVANPMQLSGACVLVVWAWLLHSWECLALAVVSVTYSAGFAAWAEKNDLLSRFGDGWKNYRARVPLWRLRLTPDYGEGSEARLQVARCGSPSSAFSDWLERRKCQGLRIVPGHADGPLRQRLSYLYPDGETEVHGAEAVASAMQHLHLGWAWVGWLLRLSGISHLMDVALHLFGGLLKRRA